MSIIGKVARKSTKMRVLDSAIHIILVLGAITMIYPFMLMLSSSVKSNVDSGNLELIPRYIHNEEALFKKYLESRYNEESSRLMDNYPGGWISFGEVHLKPNPSRFLFDAWQDFMAKSEDRFGVQDYYVAEHYGRGVYPLAQRKYRGILRDENNNSLVEFNRRYHTGAKSWEEIAVEEKEIFGRNFASSTEGYLGRFREFKRQSPMWMRYYVNPEGAFLNSELIPEFSSDLSKLNAAWGTQYRSWNDIRLPERLPKEGDPIREHWLNYIREVVSLQQLRIDGQAVDDLQAMLKEKYDSIAMLNETWGTNFNDFKEIGVPERMPETGAVAEDMNFFVQDRAKPEHIRARNIAADLRDYLAQRYPGIEAFNQAAGTAYSSWEDIPYPAYDIDYYTFLSRKAAIRKEFLWRNYAMALDQMLADARSLRNTGIYVLLSILFAITVNPLAAYALSRFKPKFTYQMIMLFMLTMAFPVMVMGIPNFLMLKRLNLLNTFWALVLPAAADGYFIFLLKGFFDTLPREMLESARLDGASEFRLFWQFTLYLSKPILAVIALGAFNAAYRNFLFAFIVCQDQSMWTLMVHIYELMQRASAGVGYAALVIAAIPTLAIFIFFQNIIIKGIVVPMEK